jgi:hypothetical protein
MTPDFAVRPCRTGLGAYQIVVLAESKAFLNLPAGKICLDDIAR